MHRHTRLLMLIHALLDFILINAAFALAYYVRYVLHIPLTVAEANYIEFSQYIPISLGLSLGLLVIYRIEGMYTFVRGRSAIEEMYGLVTGTFTGIALVVFIFLFLRPQYY